MSTSQPLSRPDFALRRILLPTDFSESARAALLPAIFLANQWGAELHLLHVVVLHSDDPLHPEYHFPDSEEIYAHLVRVAESEMKELLHGDQGTTLKIRQHLRRALSAAPAILEFAAEHEIDLIVIGSHGRRGIRRLFLGSVAEELVRTAPCPVLTLRQAGDRNGLDGVGRVLAPVDFSDESAIALRVAKELAATYEASLDVVHVVEHPSFTHHYEPLYNRSQDLAFPHVVQRIEPALGEFVRESGGPMVETELHVLEGEPARAIVEHATARQAGLVVMSTHGLTGLEHFLLGSVTERVVRAAGCPVLTMKPRIETQPETRSEAQPETATPTETPG